MQERPDRYSATSILLHWLIAALILCNLGLGIWMEQLHGHAQTEVFNNHKSLGLTILLLSLVRLGWRLGHRWPPLPAGMARWERLLARFTHVGFYVLMLAVPLMGWAAASAWGPHSTGRFWGVVPWPDLPTPNSHELSEDLGQVHIVLVVGMVGLLLLHIAGALKHQFFTNDEVPGRMIPFLRRRAS